MENILLRRRQLLIALAVAAATVPTWSLANKSPTSLRLVGPYASVSNPLIHLAETNPLRDSFSKIEFSTWTNPDQLRAISINKAADFIATPTNVAANLYNKKIPLQLVNVSVWGILWLVSKQSNKTEFTDFAGEEILVPFRGDMPDIVLQILAQQHGMQVGKDIRFTYVPTPMDAGQLLMARRAKHALLVEPMISMLLHKSQQLPQSLIAPTLYRSLDIQQEWGRVFKRPARIPQAGVMALADMATDAAQIAKFAAAYKQAQDWCFANPEQSGAEVAKHISMLTPEAVANSIKTMPNINLTAAQAKEELEFFYRQLLQFNPSLIGGKLPDAAFYGA